MDFLGRGKSRGWLERRLPLPLEIEGDVKQIFTIPGVRFQISLLLVWILVLVIIGLLYACYFHAFGVLVMDSQVHVCVAGIWQTVCIYLQSLCFVWLVFGIFMPRAFYYGFSTLGPYGCDLEDHVYFFCNHFVYMSKHLAFSCLGSFIMESQLHLSMAAIWMIMRMYHVRSAIFAMRLTFWRFHMLVC